MTLVSLDRTDSLARLQSTIDRFLNSPFFGFGAAGPQASTVYPYLNIFKDKDGLVVRAEVPGIKPEQLQVSVERKQLTISGERTRDEKTNGGFHRRERPYGRFARTIQLPSDLDTGKATADCANGVLTVRIPASEQAKPRTITVQAA